jgi:hypothetical protein
MQTLYTGKSVLVILADGSFNFLLPLVPDSASGRHQDDFRQLDIVAVQG